MKVFLISYQPSVGMWQCRIDGGVFEVYAQMTPEQIKTIPDYLGALHITKVMPFKDMQLAVKSFPNHKLEECK